MSDGVEGMAMMNQNGGFYNMFFSPLGREYCAFYQVLMYITFVIFAITVVSGLWGLVSTRKLNRGTIVSYALAVLGVGINYFVSRLLYSMCLN